jgi:hypothetical protein
MTSPGQIDLDGNEQLDPRLEPVAKALWWRDAKRTWGQDGNDIAAENARRLWPRIASSYMDEARVALKAADG